MAKAHVSIAAHQIPGMHKENTRLGYPAPEGYKVVEVDAAGQEMAFAATLSRDPTLIDAITNKNVHSVTGAFVGNVVYEEFINSYSKGCKEAAKLRKTGKFLNLSGLYRCSARTARIIARIQHGIVADKKTVEHWMNVLYTNYPGIKNTYWRESIELAKSKGYAETFAGRRFYIDDWSKSGQWASGQDAINFRNQGAGADQSALAMSLIRKHFPDMKFFLSLHDGLFFYVKTALLGDDNNIVLDMRQMLNNINYEEHWDAELLVPMRWDASVGQSIGDVVELD